MNKILITAIAAILATSQLGCTKLQHSADYSLLNPEQGQTTAERLNARDAQARAADFEFMRGDAEIPQNQAAE